MKKRLLDSVLNKFNLQRRAVGPLADDSRVYRSLRSYLASSDSMEVTDPYEKSVWVFASINAIAQNISRVPFYIYKEKPQKKDIKMVVSDGPLPELFLNPNPQMISSTLFFATVLFMELYGESFWVFEGRDNITQVPKEIWPISPTRFEPVLERKRDGTVDFKGYWEYTAGSFKTTFAPHEILHIKYFNPYNDIRGLSPIEASKSGVEQDFFANKYNKQFFKDGVSLSGIIASPDFLTDPQFNRLKDQFEQKHAGYGNAHKVGVIEGGASFVETKAMSQRDMEFSILKNTIRGEILAAFKTNEVVLGNYSNIQCFHPDTDIMTASGFIPVANVNIGDLVATYNPKTGFMEYKPVTETFIYDYKGEAYTQKRTENGKSIPSFTDYFVTPEHKMFGKERKVKSNAGKYKTEDFIFKKIKDLDPSVDFCSIKNGNWAGDIIDFYEIEKREYNKKDYRNGSKQGYKEVSFPIVPWLKFLGWFISEGCYKSDVTFELSITQVKEKGRNKIREDLKDFPYKTREHGKEFVLSGKDLFNYLMDNVGHYCYEKRIPRDILNLHPTLLKHLFEALMDGDGTKQGKKYIYTTTSKGLVDDVFELALRLGYSPSIEGGREGIIGGDGRYPNAKPFWRVHIPTLKSSKKMVVIKPEKVEYEGKIYCVAVPPYHTLLTRYNGKSLIISNSYEGIKNAHESFWKETLLPKIIYLEDFLWSKFFSKISTGKFWGGFDTSVIEALREDFAKKVEMGKTLNEIGYPINMINKRLDMGFEDVPWGDTWFVKMGTIPVESAIDFSANPPSSNDPNEQPPSPDDTPPEEEPVEEPEKPKKDLDYTDRDTSIWANFIARQIPIENMFKNKIKKFLYEQRKRVLETVSLNAKEILNEGEEIRLLQKVLSPLYTAAVQTGAELLKEELLFDGLIVQEDINEFVKGRIEFSSRSIVQTMKNTLEKMLLEVKSAGIEVKTRRVKDLYNKTDNKVSQISRTESSAIINGVRYLLMQKQGIKYHKWLTKSENGRHTHLHGKVVKIGESFSEDFLLRYPLDKSAPVGEVVNCRCFTTPVIKIK